MLKLKHISKSFGGVNALKDVSIEVFPGEIHAILGENGAGKSTLMKVISGAHQADRGTIEFYGKKIFHNNPHLAKQNGIGIIYQEFSLVPELSVAENIFLGQPSKSWVNWTKIEEKATLLIQSLGFELEVRKKVSSLSVAQQQVVEIAKALSLDVKLLILDEPSAVLGTHEIKKLFELLRTLRAKNVSIIYISHHLEELLQLSDRITVLKDGSTIETVETNKTDKDSLVTLMVGRDLSQMYPSKNEKPDFNFENIDIRDLASKNADARLSFNVKKGEILGIGGLVGSGRTEVLEFLFGKQGKQAGQVTMDGRQINLSSPSRSISQGWGLVPEDRKQFGGIMNLSIKANMSLANLRSISNRWGIIDLKAENDIVNSLVKKLQIKLGAIEDPLSSLSGGNQQKVILAKWLNLNPRVLLIDEPSRGVDVGARADIYQIIQDLSNQGLYMILVSSDMEELMGLSDRILVMKNGCIQGELERENFSEESILRMAIGAN